jgi:hypothetical protein
VGFVVDKVALRHVFLQVLLFPLVDSSLILHEARDSSVGIVTHYWLDGRIRQENKKNPNSSEIFRIRPDRPWGPPGLLYKEYRISFLEVKRPELGANHPPLSSAEVKEKVELYFHSSCPALVYYGETFTSTI